MANVKTPAMIRTTTMDEANPTISAPVLPSKEVKLAQEHRVQSTMPIEPVPATAKAGFTIPENAIVIKIEDDPESLIASSPAYLSTHHDSTSSTSISSHSSAPSTGTEVLPLYLDEDIEAVLKERRSKIQALEQECAKLKFMLKYLEVSEMQTEVLQQKFDGPRQGSWDESCRAVLGCARRNLKE